MVYKVKEPASHALARQAFREKGECTRPELAAATGLSLVTAGKAVQALCKAGELQALGPAASGGGRPVQRYRYNPDYAQHALIQVARRGPLLHGSLDLVNLHGEQRGSRHGDFAYLEAESLDGWLDKAQRRRRLQSITLCLPEDLKRASLLEHLRHRYSCPARSPNPATILSPDEPDGTATIHLQPGGEPSCSFKYKGRILESALLRMLPLPARWADLDCSDHTLLEEMAARLLQIITCTLSPARLVLHTQPLSPRLMERIRFNASTKLRGRLPALLFRPCTPGALQNAACLFACRQP